MQPKNAKDPDMQTVADKVGAAIDISELSQVPDAYVENVMGIALDGYASRNTLISAVGTNINEYGIFLAKDADQAATIKAALDKYLEYRESILGDSDRAAVKQAFESCFEG